MSALPPGPRYPAALQMVGFWTRPLAFLEQCRARYGRRFTLRLPMTPPFVMLTDPDDVKQVFTAPADILHPGSGARVLEPVIGRHSVILLDEAPHMEQRKLMLPAFHGERVERLSELIESVTERAVAGWPSDRSVHLHRRLQQLTLEVILRAVFGLEPGPRMDALRDRLGVMLAFGEKPISLMPPTNPDGVPAKILARVGPFAAFVRNQREADTLIFGLIDERRRQADQQDDVLSLLLAATHEDGSPMSDQELRDELLTLLVAGHETTASTLAWGFDRLSGHPEVVDRLREDGDDYLGATIHEIMRRRPVIPNVAPRLVVKPIEVGGWSYPQGVCLVPNAYLIHHDPEIYPEPYAFRPERFLDKPPGTYTWIPFGGGRRRCLGASFAMLEMKVVLREVLRQRELAPIGDRFALPQRRNITVTPANGAEVRLPVRAEAPLAAAAAG